jgi:hypothetical protein
MKNSLTDLNNHLFMRLEALSDESVTGKALENEIKRSNAIVKLSSEIVKAGTLQYKSVRLALENKSVFKEGMLPIVKDTDKNLIGSPTKSITHVSN